MNPKSRLLLLSLLAFALIVCSFLFFIFSPASKGYVTVSSPFKAAYLISDPTKTEIQIHIVLPLSAAAQSSAEGLPHYVEHLAWLNSVGAKMRLADRHSNAWTNKDTIGYWLAGQKDGLSEMLRSLIGIFKPISLSVKFADEEKKIVQREYDLRLGNNLDGRVFDAQDQFLYKGNYLAKSSIGTVESIAALNFEQAMALHAETHVMPSAVLVVIGDIDQSELEAELKKLPETESQPKAQRKLSLFNLAENADETKQFPDKNAAPRLILRRIVKLEKPEQFDVLRAKLSLLEDMLDTNLPGGLAKPIRFDQRIASSFAVSVWPIDEAHAEISFIASPDAGVSLTSLKAAFEESFATTSKAGFPEETFQRVRARFTAYWPEWDDEDEVRDWMAGHILDTVPSGRMPLSIDELKSIDRDLTLESINEILNQFTSGGRTSAAFIGPQGSFK